MTMETLTDFLVSNYLWFLVTSIILVFALIGYLVDQQEQKKGISTINKPKLPELNMEDLVSIAQNKSLNNAVSDAMKNNGVEMNTQANNNIISQVPNNTIGQNGTSNNASTVGFNVLNK